MARINEKGYVERASKGAKGQSRSKSSKIYRDWWLIKVGTALTLARIYIPARYIGKKIRVKIEVIKENKK